MNAADDLMLNTNASIIHCVAVNGEVMMWCARGASESYLHKFILKFTGRCLPDVRFIAIKWVMRGRHDGCSVNATHSHVRKGDPLESTPRTANANEINDSNYCIYVTIYTKLITIIFKCMRHGLCCMRNMKYISFTKITINFVWKKQN